MAERQMRLAILKNWDLNVSDRCDFVGAPVSPILGVCFILSSRIGVFSTMLSASQSFLIANTVSGPPRQTTADFLTSMTSPGERRVKSGYESTVPHTPDEFAERWRSSKARQELSREIAEYSERHPSKERLYEYRQSRRAEQAKMQRPNSSYTISYASQVSLTLWRAMKRLKADPSFTIIWLVYHVVISLILGSMYYNLKEDSSSFFYRGGLIFLALVFNAFSSQIEVSQH